MSRFWDWRTRFYEALDSFEGKPFAWGTNDCAVFANTGILALTGEDHLAAVLKTSYSDQQGSDDTLRALGFADLPALIASLFPERPALARSQVGDLVVIPAPGDRSGLGFMLGERIGCLHARGYGTVPRGAATRAFIIE